MSSVTGNSDNVFINNANLKIAKAGKGLIFADGTVLYTANAFNTQNLLSNIYQFTNAQTAFVINEVTANTGFAGNTAPTDAISVSSNLFISYTGNLITYGQLSAGSVANVESNILTLETDLSDNSSRIDAELSNIVTLQNDLSDNSSRIDAELSNIVTLQSDLSDNSSRIDAELSNIVTLQEKTTDITWSGDITTIANDLTVGGDLTVTGNVITSNNIQTNDPIFMIASNAQNDTTNSAFLMGRTRANVMISHYPDSGAYGNVVIGYTLDGSNSAAISLDTGNNLSLYVQGNIIANTSITTSNITTYGNLFVNSIAMDLTKTSNVITYDPSTGEFFDSGGEGGGGGSNVEAGTAGQIAYYSTTTTVKGDGALTFDETNSNVDVTGNVNVTGNTHSNLVTSIIYFGSSPATPFTGGLTLSNVVNKGNTTSNTVQFTNTGTSLVTSGSVGVGTTSPLANLHVVGNVFTTSNIELTGDNFIYNGSGSSLLLKSNAGVQINSYVDNINRSLSYGSRIGLYDNNMYLDGSNIYLRNDSSAPTFAHFKDGNLSLYSSGGEGGEIKLHDKNHTPSTDPAKYWSIDVDTNSSYRVFRIGDTAYTPLSFSNTGTATVSSSGGSPSKLILEPNAALIDAPLHYFRSSGFVNRMIIDANGNVGIGRDSPDEKLDVNGNILVNYIGRRGGTASVAQAGLLCSSLADSNRCRILPAKSNGSFALTDANVDFGAADYRFNTIYASVGSINTSDRNLKISEADINAAELRVASNISTMFKTFKFKQAYEERGENARTHVGVIAQDIGNALTAEGLDKSRYAFYCEDQIYRENGTNVHIDTYWQEVSNVQNYMINENPPQEVFDENPQQEPNWEQVHDLSTLPNVHTITRYGVRYSELLCFVCQSFSDKLSSFESRLAALENN